MDDLVINRRLTIPARCIGLETSTASGPGGQHVNRARTRVTLTLNIDQCEAIGPTRASRLKARLGRRVEADGTIRVVCGRSRHQSRNLQEASLRLADLIRGGLAPVPVRRPTRPTRASKARRRASKAQRGQQKQSRGWTWDRSQ